MNTVTSEHEKAKPALDRPVIVEGKYDKIKLSSVFDAHIITTDGFGIFKETEKRDMIRRIADKNGIIVLTDSDGAGLVIRNYINSILPKNKIVHLYVPALKGREKRKKSDSKEGLLGVEGIDADFLRRLFDGYVIKDGEAARPANTREITRLDFYGDGLSGTDGSSEKRRRLAEKAGLPLNLSAGALLDALNLIFGYDEYKILLNEVDREKRDDMR